MVTDYRNSMHSNRSNVDQTSTLNSKSAISNNISKVHYNSTPIIIDETSSIKAKKSVKMLAVKVMMLDDTFTIFQIQTKALGRVLFNEVCKQLNLLEADYFGLEYQGSDNILYWLDLEKSVNRQISLSLIDVTMKFCVKFYTPDPSQLEEEFTRYLFCLNIKRDLSLGSMQCNENTAALIASYIVQAECGDFVPEDYPDHSYLACYKFIPNQTEGFLKRIMENHKKHMGQPPAEADLNVLETARRCELYGIKMHPAKDCEGGLLNLSVAHMGIVVFQNLTKINTFSWAKIRKISFKRKRFLIKFHAKEYEHYKDIVEFFFDSRNECKNFWKKCVEHHSFYRCTSVKYVSRHRRRVLSRGSSFRYSGKTQKEVVEFVRENFVKRQSFQRSTSFRHSALYTSSANVCTKPFGSSVSAHPLIPLIDSDADDVVQTSHLDVNRNRIIDQKIGQATPIFRSNNTQTTNTKMLNMNGATKKSNIISYNENVVDDESPIKENNISLNSNREIPSPPPTITIQASVHDSKSELTGINQNIENNKIENKTNSCLSNNTTDLKVIPITNGIKNKADIKKPIYFDASFHIIKELFLTEITFKKDLDVVNLWFREEVGKEDPSESCFLLSLISPLAGAHYQFLYDLELRLYGKDGHYVNNKYEQAIGDILLKHFKLMKPLYEEFIENHYGALERLNQSIKSNSSFEKLYFEFENQKVCYLSFSSFVLKPLYRLLQYGALIKSLLKMYGKEHIDYENCSSALCILDSFVENLKSSLEKSINFVVLFELQNVLPDINFLNSNQRKYDRQGCLLKLSHRGDYRPLLFILMTDVLLYLSKHADNSNFFLKGLIKLKNTTIEDYELDTDIHAFMIHTENRTLVLVANSYSEKRAWISSIQRAINEFQSLPEIEFNFHFKNFDSSDELNEIVESNHSKTVNTSQKNNKPIYVCWHRFISITLNDYMRTAETQLSGYLLRRFKANNGWQKLWVVYSNFCLFFYKSSTDDFPLASLPILGYSISIPNNDEFVNKDYIFQLKYKKHIYIFRAESDFSHKRWMDVLKEFNDVK